MNPRLVATVMMHRELHPEPQLLASSHVVGGFALAAVTRSSALQAVGDRLERFDGRGGRVLGEGDVAAGESA